MHAIRRLSLVTTAALAAHGCGGGDDGGLVDPPDASTDAGTNNLGPSPCAAGNEIVVSLPPIPDQQPFQTRPGIAWSGQEFAISYRWTAFDGNFTNDIHLALLDRSDQLVETTPKEVVAGAVPRALAARPGSVAVLHESPTLTRLDGSGAVVATVDVSFTPVANAVVISRELVAAGPEYAIALGLADDRGVELDMPAGVVFLRVDAGDAVVETSPIDSPTAFQPSLVFTGSEYAVAWSDDRGAARQVFVARIDAGGARIGDEISITAAAGGASNPSLAWTGQEYGLFWIEAGSDGRQDVRFARLDSTGSMVGAPIALIGDPATGRFDAAREGADLVAIESVWTGAEHVAKVSRFGGGAFIFTIDPDGRQAGYELDPPAGFGQAALAADDAGRVGMATYGGSGDAQIAYRALRCDR